MDSFDHFYFKYFLKKFSNFDTKILSWILVISDGHLFSVKSLRGFVDGIDVVCVITIGPCCLLSSKDLLIKKNFKYF